MEKNCFDDYEQVKECTSNITITTELEVIINRFSKFVDSMKLHIRELLKKIAFPETTDLKPPSQPVKTKGASKKAKSS